MLRLITFKGCRETVAFLRLLLRKAWDNEVRGLVVCYWTTSGTREVVLTGVYRHQPEHALVAADLIKVRACRQLDLFQQGDRR